MGSDSSVVDRLVSDRKVADPGSIPELAMRPCVLGKDTLSLFPFLAKQSTLVVVP